MRTKLSFLVLAALVAAGCGGPKPYSGDSASNANSLQTNNGQPPDPTLPGDPQVAGGPGGPGGRDGGPGGLGGGGGFDPEAFFNRRDENGDGKLSGEEISERMRESLAETDTDGDGEVSLEEFKVRMEAMRAQGFGGRGGGGEGGGGGGRGGAFGDPEERFKERDENGDGKLAGDEISERLQERLAEFDKDEDGAFSLEEYRAMIESFRARGGGGRGGGGGDRPQRPDRPERPERPPAEDP